jgi:RHS repeat-associated protein
MRTYTSPDTYREQLQYFDGLGRPDETVLKRATPKGKDLVVRYDYDNFGRESKTWLPAPSSRTDGGYNGASAAASFYSDAAPYSETRYEPSPLNRVSDQYGPGQLWRDNSRRVKTEYLTNSATNAELICRYYYMEDASRFRRSDNYAAGQLYVTKMTDEENHVSYEFKDKFERVLLQRRMDGNTFFDTYYIYDDFGNVKYILPPIASDRLSQDNASYKIFDGSDEANKVLAEYCYFYRYDQRQRVTVEVMPAFMQEFIYDKADRLVMQQTPYVPTTDGQRGWLFHKYDALGREILTGIYHGDDGSAKDVNARAYEMQNRFNNLLSTETRVIGYPYSYSWNVFPSYDQVTVTNAYYYDTYPLFINVASLSYSSKPGYGERYSTSAKGLLTGSRAKLLDGGDQDIMTTYFYDFKGNLIQKRSTNQSGGADAEYYAYNYTNQMTGKCIEQTIPGKSTVTEVYEYNYDTQGRLTNVKHSFNGSAPVTLSAYTYDEVGRVSKKTLGSGEKITSTYNIRSWLTALEYNKSKEKLHYTDNPKQGGSSYFNGNIAAMQWEVLYEQRDSMIVRDTLPKIKDPVELRSLAAPAIGSGLVNLVSSYWGYSFSYDALNRLTLAVYGTGSSLSNDAGRYDESFTYDKHGNILSLQRSGLKDNNTFGLIDDLTMPIYNGNLLRKVVDAAGNQSSSDVMEFKDNYHGSNTAEEYIYNAGRLVADYNKGICQIRYNQLTLPTSVQFRNGNRIEYVYDAQGVKRTVRHKEANRNMNFSLWDLREPAEPDILHTETTEYIGNKIYVNGELTKILTEEGYIEKSSNAYHYFYYLKDHLGNNRAVLNASNAVVQENHFYPSGTSMAMYPRRTDQGLQPYKFGGKELDRSFGMDFYDFDARGFDPVIMRFTTRDPLTQYYAVSSYAYCNNNPIRYTDPTGKWIAGTDGKPVTFTNGQWSSNASADVQRVGNAMMGTNEGTGHLNDMLSPNSQKISIEISSSIVNDGNNYDTGLTTNRAGKDASGNLIIAESKITIYEGSIQHLTGSESGNNQLKGLDMEDAIGVVVGHEKGHTEKESVKQSYENAREGTTHDTEARPIEIENKILDELKNRSNQ